MKEETKTLITEIMNEDAKDGLYDVREDENFHYGTDENGVYRKIIDKNDVREDDLEKDDLEIAIEKFEKLLNGKALPTKQLTKVAEHYFILGYIEAKENTYTEEQLEQAIEMARLKSSKSFIFYNHSVGEIKQLLKQQSK